MKKRILWRSLALTTALALGLAVSAAGTEETLTPDSAGPVAKALEIATYRNIPYRADFLATGDPVDYQLETEPRKGTVAVEGGSFLYTPDPDKTGTDSFTYTATDAEGRTSAPAKVSVTIQKTKSGVTYADLDGRSCAAAAQALAEKGVFVGAQLGGQYFFEPERTVSRSEFLALTMEMAGLEADAVTMTGFCDDGAIPAWAKAYASAGLSQGVIRGSSTPEGVAFRPDAPISCQEAAVILDRVLSVSDVDLETWYADRTAAPSWAAQAVGNLESVGVLAAGSYGGAGLEQAVTRGDAAQMLAAAGELLEGEPTGLLAWLR